MTQELNGFKVAILVADGFEQVELVEPKKALEDAGANTVIISPAKDAVQGWHHDKKTDKFPVDVPLEQAIAEQYDALLLPGGVMNPDTLRLNMAAIEFIKKIGSAQKPIAAICHGPWTLIDAGLVFGKEMTSWPSLKMDLINAGAHWIDKEVVRDDKLVTSRKPQDLPAFNKMLIEVFMNSSKKKHNSR